MPGYRSGKQRAPLADLAVYPRPLQDRLPIWIAVGGTPESAVRAGSLGLPMALGIIGGLPERFAGIARLHREAARRAGHPEPPLSINSHGFIAGTWREATDLAFPAYAATMNRIGRERGWPPMSRQQFDESTTLRGANFVGTPEQVIEKILYQHEIFAHQRFMLQITVGALPHDAVLRCIERFGSEVAPVVRRETGSATP